MSVQHANSHMFLSPKRYNKRIQDSFLTQKLLCKGYLVFFCFVQYSCDDYLNKESVLKVVSIVNKRDRNQLSIWVDYIFTKANKYRKEKKDCISFYEFKNLILNTGDVMR